MTFRPLVLALVAMLAAPAAFAQSASLSFSATADRANPAPLAGAVLSSAEPIFAFLTPLDVFLPGAIFVLNGNAIHFDLAPPYDASVDGFDNPVPLPSNFLRGGENTLQVVTLDSSPPIEAVFEIDAPADVLELADELGSDLFVAIVEGAGLAATLTGPGDVTVFVPTDQAVLDFVAASGQSLAELLADPPALQALVAAHTVNGFFDSTDAIRLGTLRTLAQAALFAESENGEWVLNQTGAVIDADNLAGNGLVHTIDAVLGLPRTALEAAAAAGLNHFVAAVQATGLASLIESLPLRTILAPDDAAFDALAVSLGVSFSELLADTATLEELLLYHLVADSHAADALPAPTRATAAGLLLRARNVDGEIVINDEATLGATDIQTSVGYLHSLDGVLTLPVQVPLQLSFSLSADLSDPQPLDGATVPDDPKLRLFVSPATGGPNVFLGVVALNSVFEATFGTPIELPRSALRDGTNDAFVLLFTDTGIEVLTATFEVTPTP